MLYEFCVFLPGKYRKTYVFNSLSTVVRALDASRGGEAGRRVENPPCGGDPRGLRRRPPRFRREPPAGTARKTRSPAQGHRVAHDRPPANQQDQIHRPVRRADPFGRQRAAGRGYPARGGQVRPDARNPPGDPRRRGGDQDGLEYGRTDGVCPHGPVCPYAGRLRAGRDGHCHQYRRRHGDTPRFHGAETLFRTAATLLRTAVRHAVDGHVARLSAGGRVRLDDGARRLVDIRPARA